MATLDVQIGHINFANVEQLRTINTSTLPVRYTDKFYKDLVTHGNADYLKFAHWNGFAVGAVCARTEDHESIPGSKRLYIMTINVLAAYRRRGIATKLLNYVLEQAAKDDQIVEVYLNVQTSNSDAKQFYLKHGFVDCGVIENYYKRIDPPHCFLLRKSLKEGYDISQTIGGGNQQTLTEEN